MEFLFRKFFVNIHFHSKKTQFDIERIKAKLEEQNAELVKRASVLPQHECKPRGIAVPRATVDLTLLAHELNTGARLAQDRGVLHQKANTRIDYHCRSFEDCPFVLSRFDYLAFPDVSYFQIKRPHVHVGEQRAEARAEFHPEILNFIRAFRGHFRVRQLRSDLEDFVDRALHVPDIISDQHRRQYPQYPLAVVQAVDVDALLPSNEALYKRLSYQRKQERLFADPAVLEKERADRQELLDAKR